jgi:UDP-GlcNAc:undecaprenyl-phosphate/decaprenyl-phosphate GlcNAc-1-phosphate transferase
VAVCSWFTLRERAMLGDTGASLIGGLIAVSVYGEFRSISAAIERVPLIQRLDSLGRVN